MAVPRVQNVPTLVHRLQLSVCVSTDHELHTKLANAHMLWARPSYRFPEQSFSCSRHLLPRQPTPPRQSAARRVKQSEVVGISNSRDSPEQASSSEVARLYVIHTWNAPQVGLIYAEGGDRGSCENDRWDDRARFS
jgi:hypothetical protein